MAKRGCTVDFLHFHPFRSGKEVEKSKMVDIVKKLKQWGISGRLWVAPFYPFQAVVPEGRTEVVLFRRHMLRVAEALARREGHAALVTGDNLGQVASQTLTNLAATSNNIGLPVLRPVITYDKSEIVTLAQRIGTYEPSIIEYRDCCSLVARNPVTHARDRDIKEAEEKFDTAALVNETLSATETVVCD
jgi:thiamine biosynthesis protein ThiI